jgi:hypothetical protein
LGVLELSTHENGLVDFCTIANEVTDLTVFTTADVHERIEAAVNDGVRWLLRAADEPLRSFLSRVEDETERLDLLWSFPLYGTVVDYIHYARFNPSCRFLMAAYDTNGWIGRNPVLTPKIYNYLKYPARRWQLRRIDTLVVEFDPIREYVDQFLSIPVQSFTPVVYDGDDASGENGRDRTVITVPGLLDETRRKYDDVVQAFSNTTFQHDVEIVLLGAPVDGYGERLLARFEALGGDGLTVTTFDDWIAVETFDSYLRNSDLLVGPLRRTRDVDGYREIYGRTKGSGILSDGVRRALPVCLPGWYEIPERHRPATLTYDSPAELRSIIDDIVDPGRRTPVRNGAQAVANEYRPERQRDRLRRILAESVE